jgi:hypothetical protein
MRPRGAATGHDGRPPHPPGSRRLACTAGRHRRRWRLTLPVWLPAGATQETSEPTALGSDALRAPVALCDRSHVPRIERLLTVYRLPARSGSRRLSTDARTVLPNRHIRHSPMSSATRQVLRFLPSGRIFNAESARTSAGHDALTTGFAPVRGVSGIHVPGTSVPSGPVDLGIQNRQKYPPGRHRLTREGLPHSWARAVKTPRNPADPPTMTPLDTSSRPT